MYLSFPYHQWLCLYYSYIFVNTLLCQCHVTSCWFRFCLYRPYSKSFTSVTFPVEIFSPQTIQTNPKWNGTIITEFRAIKNDVSYTAEPETSGVSSSVKYVLYIWPFIIFIRHPQLVTQFKRTILLLKDSSIKQWSQKSQKNGICDVYVYVTVKLLKNHGYIGIKGLTMIPITILNIILIFSISKCYLDMFTRQN